MTDHFPDSEQTIKTKNGGVKLVLWTKTKVDTPMSEIYNASNPYPFICYCWYNSHM
jgi:hypothetical protein